MRVNETGERVSIQADGTFQFPALAPGTYSLTFQHRQGSRAKLNSLSLEGRGDAAITVTIQQGRAFLQEKVHLHRDKADLMGRVLDVGTDTFSLQAEGMTFVIGWNAETRWIHLSGVQDLQAGQDLEVKGRVTGTQQVMAEKIRLHEPQGAGDGGGGDGGGRKMEACGEIEAVDPAAQTLVVQGTTFFWDDGTEFEHLAPEDLAVGMMVKVEGVEQPDGSWWAEKIEAEDHCGH